MTYFRVGVEYLPAILIQFHFVGEFDFYPGSHSAKRKNNHGGNGQNSKVIAFERYHRTILQAIMPKSAKKKRKLPGVSVAQIYNEDVGFEGLKKKRISSTSGISFHLPIDEQEEKKRQERMVSDLFCQRR